MDSPSDIQMKEVPTPHCGTLKVFVQGDLDNKQGKTVFLTCHDVGSSHKSWFPLIMHSSMTEVRLRSIFLHVCLPGQEENAQDLPLNYTFPLLDQIAQDLGKVLDYFGVKSVIGMGDGAGANIITRFAINQPNSLMGIILCHCTSTTAGVMEFISSKMMGRKLSTTGLNQSINDYLVDHKFGSQDKKLPAVTRYVENLKSSMNPVNLSKFFDAFLKRTDLSGNLAGSLKVETLLVSGSKASHLHTMQTMHSAMNKGGSSLLVVDGVGNVIAEEPQRLARALILFCKGCGVLSGVGIPGMEKQRTLSSSMEEADQPVNRSLGREV